jgi:hypothetical protein
MNTKEKVNINLQEIRKAITVEIESLQQALIKVDDLISEFNTIGPLPEEPLKFEKKAAVKKQEKKKDNTGREKLSKYLLDYMRDNKETGFDMTTLADAVIKAINEGKVTAPAGKVKDEIGKRLFQFKKRGDISKNLDGTFQFSYRGGAHNGETS